MHNSWRAQGQAKQALKSAGAKGSTLAALVQSVTDELARRRAADEEVRELLRSYGCKPNGKRLVDAVDEVLRRFNATRLTDYQRESQ
jgi:hypothetical protein